MTIHDVTPKQVAAANNFFLGIGQVGRANERFDNDLTMPLFPLWLILDADGTLADDARGILDAGLKP